MNVLFARREFLNFPGWHTTASIVADLTESFLDEPNEVGWKNWVSATFHIADCDRKIKLDLDLVTDEDFENTLYKMDMIIAVTKDMRAALKKHRKYIQKVNGSKP